MNDERNRSADDVPVITPSHVDLIDERDRGRDWYERESPALERQVRRRSIKWPLLLFIATCLSTFFAGMGLTAVGSPPRGVPIDRLWNGTPAEQRLLLTNGATFSASLILILFCHEMGHYLQARRHGVHATLPYFIPMPITPFGTMGAVIFQDPTSADRRQMFDIAVSGPLAGLVVALPIAYFGVQDSVLAVMRPNQVTVQYGDPLILKWMIAAKHGELAANQDVWLHNNPLLFAGWVGIFITALNLLPVSQLDGGHILYTLLGPPARRVAKLLMWISLFYMWMTGNWAYFPIWLLVLFAFGVSHPPTANDRVPLGPFRQLIGWATLAFIIVGFTPMPMQMR